MPDHFLPVQGQTSPLVSERSHHPRNYGPLSQFDGQACITGPCGDTMEFWIQVDVERVTRVGFTTTGCGASRAAGSMATELAVGKPLLAVVRIGQAEILTALGGLPPESEHCALLAANTLHAAIQDYVRHEATQTDVPAATPQRTGAGGACPSPHTGR